VQGNVLVNGVPPTMHFARISGYVQQETQFFQILTVRETLMYAAKLKLPYTVPMSEKEKMVEQLIRDLDLEKCANTRVGFGTSGGERRRLSLAMELIDGPSLIFCE
jgi:ATP-binding cassette subfamily G (WHITE) protein 2